MGLAETGFSEKPNLGVRFGCLFPHKQKETVDFFFFVSQAFFSKIQKPFVLTVVFAKSAAVQVNSFSFDNAAFQELRTDVA